MACRYGVPIVSARERSYGLPPEHAPAQRSLLRELRGAVDGRWPHRRYLAFSLHAGI